MTFATVVGIIRKGVLRPALDHTHAIAIINSCIVTRVTQYSTAKFYIELYIEQSISSTSYAQCTYCNGRKNNCQKIQPAHSKITKRDFILRGSCFCEKYCTRIYEYGRHDILYFSLIFYYAEQWTGNYIRNRQTYEHTYLIIHIPWVMGQWVDRIIYNIRT